MIGEQLKPDRRRFCSFVFMLPLLLPAGCAVTAVDRDTLRQFRVLSSRLTGFALPDIEPAAAAALFQGLQDSGDGQQLAALLAGAADAELENRIIDAWYSGLHPAQQGMVVHTVSGALAWRAIEYTGSPAPCRAGVGDWSRPPSGRQVYTNREGING